MSIFKKLFGSTDSKDSGIEKKPIESQEKISNPENVNIDYGDLIKQLIEQRNFDTIKEMIHKNDISIKWINPKNKLSLIETICLHSKSSALPYVQWLVENGADVNLSNELDTAVEFTSLEVVEYLISVGADVKVKGLISSCIFSWSTNQRHKIVAALLKAGADPTGEDSGGTNLHGAIIMAQESSLRDEEVEIVKILLEYGCDTTIRDEDSHTPMTLAQEYEDNEIIEILENVGISSKASQFNTMEEWYEWASAFKKDDDDWRLKNWDKKYKTVACSSCFHCQHPKAHQGDWYYPRDGKCYYFERVENTENIEFIELPNSDLVNQMRCHYWKNPDLMDLLNKGFHPTAIDVYVRKPILNINDAGFNFFRFFLIEHYKKK